MTTVRLGPIACCVILKRWAFAVTFARVKKLKQGS